MKSNFLLLLFLLFTNVSIYAQKKVISGKVIDYVTKEELAFVNIVKPDGKSGTVSDIDGEFSLEISLHAEYLTFSYVGYYPLKYKITDKTNNLIIELKQKNISLNEVKVYPGINPAHRIINQVIDNRKINNPEKKKSFSYTSYSKMLVTGYYNEKEKSKYAIEDTVEFERIQHDSIQQDDTVHIQMQSATKQIDIDSATVAKLLKDTAILHTVIIPLLDDTATRHQILGYLEMINATAVMASLRNDSVDTKPYTNQISKLTYLFRNNSDDINENKELLSELDSIILNPAVQKIIVPTAYKLLQDSTVREKILNEGTLNQYLLNQTLQKNKKNNPLDKHHIFISEYVTERIYMHPDNNYEKIIAARISGLQDPLFVMLATQFQSFSFYNDIITLGRKDYVNPISSRSTRKYFFHIEDTIYTNADTVFLISFQPKKNKIFDALEGILYVNSNGYALQNVIAQSAQKSFLELKIKQNLSFPDVNVMNKGYYEAGISIEKIVNLKIIKLGIAGYYRFGPYSFDKFHENCATNLVVNLPF